MPPAEASEDLVGLDEQRAIELLGPPATTEDRAPARIWHYKSSRCELELIFFMEMRTGLMRTLHYDFKAGADNPKQQQACLTAIMRENLKGTPGEKSLENDTMAESTSGSEALPAPAAASIQSEVPPASEPKQETSRSEPYVPRGHWRHHPRSYAVRRRMPDSGACARAQWSQPDAAGVPVWLCN